MRIYSWHVFSFDRIIATIVSPTPILAANFIIIGRLVNHLGPQYSRLKPKRCTFIAHHIGVYDSKLFRLRHRYISVSSEYMRIVLAKGNTKSILYRISLPWLLSWLEGEQPQKPWDPEKVTLRCKSNLFPSPETIAKLTIFWSGGRIMLAGIVFQLREYLPKYSCHTRINMPVVFIIIFSCLSIGFVRRYAKDKPVHKELRTSRGSCDSKEQLMLLGLFISTFCMLVRWVIRPMHLLK